MKNLFGRPSHLVIAGSFLVFATYMLTLELAGEYIRNVEKSVTSTSKAAYALGCIDFAKQNNMRTEDCPVNSSRRLLVLEYSAD